MFNPSPYQSAVFEVVAGHKRSVFVKAVAGSGKSTTILRSFAHLDPRWKCSLLQFNKRIEQENKKKVLEIAAEYPEDVARVMRAVRIQTGHSAGLGAWRYRFPSTQVNFDKSWAILDAAVDANRISKGDVQMYGTFVVRLVGLAKNNGLGALRPMDARAFEDLIDHHGLTLDEADDYDKAIDMAERLLRQSQEWSTRTVPMLDGDDMLYEPIRCNVSFFKQDVLFVDEEQDSNEIQIEMFGRMLKTNGCIIGVGDPRQAIYGFRGADASAVDKFITKFKCVELPLTISYRCAPAIVRSVHHIVPYIQANPDATVEGEVVTVKRKDIEYRPTDGVLCRVNAPLVSEAMSLIARKVPCKILGRDIGKGLITLVKKLKAKDLEDLQVKLEGWLAKEVKRWTDKRKESMVQAAQDRAACIQAIIDTMAEDAAVADVISELDSLFTDDESRDMLTLASIHRAKGSEWDRVFILRPDMLQLRANKEWQQVQEANCEYVARTRAKTYLAVVTE